MVKSESFKERPKAPTRGQIAADIARAPCDDIVFRNLSKVSEENNKNEDTSSKHLPQGQNLEAYPATGPDETVVEDTYKQVTKLIQLQAQLTNEPKMLQEKYEQLEKLGDDVSQSITELKSASESVVKQPEK